MESFRLVKHLPLVPALHSPCVDGQHGSVREQISVSVIISELLIATAVENIKAALAWERNAGQDGTSCSHPSVGVGGCL